VVPESNHISDNRLFYFSKFGPIDFGINAFSTAQGSHPIDLDSGWLKRSGCSCSGIGGGIGFGIGRRHPVVAKRHSRRGICCRSLSHSTVVMAHGS